MTLGMFLLDHLQHKGGGEPESYLGIAFMIILPICLIIGSLVAGYLSQPYIRNAYLFILLCPGLYAAIYVVGNSGGTIEGFLESMLLCSVVWILTSVVGVYLGKYLRAKRIKSLTRA
jgi:predicted branched-subunit amino acid permease